MTPHTTSDTPAGVTPGWSGRWRSVVAAGAALAMTASLAAIAAPSAQSSQQPLHPLSCTETQRIDTVSSTSGVALGDFNGNGKPGFATSGAGFDGEGWFEGKIWIHHRADDGSFLEPDVYALPNKETGDKFAFRIPNTLVARDLNGDGLADLAGPNRRTDDVSVLASSGVGSDFRVTHYPTGDGQRVGLNNHGPNNEDALGKTYATGARPEDLVAADVTGNGAPDLVTVNSGSEDVSVLANAVGRAGVDAFALAGNYPVHDADSAFGAGYGPRQITAGDFDEDGAPDLGIRIAAEPNRTDETFLSSVAPDSVEDEFVDDQNSHIVLMDNSGTGAFTPSNKLRLPNLTGSAPSALVAGDITGDGHIDLGAAEYGSAYLLPGRGDGTFRQPDVQRIAGRMLNGSARFLETMGAVDLTDDGSQELVFGGGAPGADLTALVDTDQGFAEAVHTPTGTSPRGIDTFKSDDELLVITANSNHVTIVAQGDEDCVFDPPENRYELSGFARAPGAVALGDLTGNGKVDLATANADSNDVSVLAGNGQGNFTEEANSPYDLEDGTSSGPADIAIADLTGDGVGEIITANADTDRVSVLVRDGSGVFAEHTDSPHAVGTTPTGVAVADVTGDGELDVVSANKGADTVSVLAGDGSGSLSPTSGSPHAVGTDPVDVVVDELTGDSALDLATANKGSDNLSVLANDGSGGFAPTSGSPLAVGTDADPVAVVAAELTGDSPLDVAALNQGTDTVSVFAGDGSGGFTETSASPTPASNSDHNSTPLDLAVSEATGDANQDLIVANGIRHFAVLPGDGNGGFDRPLEHKTREAPRSLAVGDVNGDGRPDVASGNFDGGRLNMVSVLLHRPPQTQTSATTTDAGGGGLTTSDVSPRP